MTVAFFVVSLPVQKRVLASILSFVELDLHLNPLHSTRRMMKDSLTELELQVSHQARTIDLLINMAKQPGASATDSPNDATTVDRETVHQLEELQRLIAHQRN